ncbi:MAG: S-layer protein, partial [Planctomyces sp.]
MLFRCLPARLTLLLTLLLTSAAFADTGETLRILPAELRLHGPADSSLVLVERFRNSVAVGPDTAAELISDDPRIVQVEGRRLIPVSNGSTTVRLKNHARNAPVQQVTVTAMEQPTAWSFRNHVEPVLARQGCSSGACHGALAGKGGFRLSLRGYDPERDFFTTVQQQLGRRVELADPATSLLLTKPTMAVPHKGGLRLTTDSIGYRILSEWIAAGAAGPADTDARLERLEVIPDRVLAAVGTTQPLLVRAHYSDGRSEDVTHLAKFTASAEAVASVDEHGSVSITGSGEGAV